MEPGNEAKVVYNTTESYQICGTRNPWAQVENGYDVISTCDVIAIYSWVLIITRIVGYSILCRYQIMKYWGSHLEEFIVEYFEDINT